MLVSKLKLKCNIKFYGVQIKILESFLSLIRISSRLHGGDVALPNTNHITAVESNGVNKYLITPCLAEGQVIAADGL